jgi:hypothetical protein
MYLYQAMQESDKDEFLEAMVQEIDSHTAAGNWSILHKSKISQGSPVIPAVRQMKLKRRISTREVYKRKARLNFDGSKQVKGVSTTERHTRLSHLGPHSVLS